MKKKEFDQNHYTQITVNNKLEELKEATSSQPIIIEKKT